MRPRLKGLNDNPYLIFTIHGVWFIFRTAEYMFATAEYMFTTAEYMFRSAEYKTNACFVEISAGNETK